MRYRVTFAQDVDADSPEDAEAIARSRPTSGNVRVVSLERPKGAYDYRGFYVQPIHVLDLAWDEYMDRTAGESMYWNGRVPRLPSILQLVSAGLDLVHISMLFDLAITVFEQRMTGGDSVPEQRSGGRHAE